MTPCLNGLAMALSRPSSRPDLQWLAHLLSQWPGTRGRLVGMDEEVPDLDDAMGKVGPGRKALQHVPDPVGIASDSLLETVGLLVNLIYHSFSHRVIK